MHFARIFPFGSGRSPPAPATSLLELDSGRHHHHLLLLFLVLRACSTSSLVEAANSTHNYQHCCSVCVWRTEAPYNKTGQGKRIWIKVCNLPPWNLVITPSRAHSIISRTSFTHARNTIITSTQQYGKRSSLSHLITNFSNIWWWANWTPQIVSTNCFPVCWIFIQKNGSISSHLEWLLMISILILQAN